MARPLTEALKKVLDLEDEELFPEEPEREVKSGRGTQAQQIVNLALTAGIELFHTPDRTAYASIPIGGHIETWPLRKIRFWLSRLFFDANKKPPGNQALQDALNVLEAKALFEGPCYPVNTRIADPNGNIYIDLANDAWQAVEVSSSGWRVVDRPPVKFRRTKGMLPLPVPQRGGTLDLLRDFVNVADDSQWVLLVSWLLSAFRPRGPYPVLLLQGEQGCAKSTTARVLKSLVDPNISHLRTSPRDERDLLIAATNGWTLAFDNLSGIPDWLSDAFCRLSTGGGFATRQLYSDDEEVIFDAQRPVVLNGIDDLAWRHDLLDRAIVLNLPVIPESKRKSEAEFWGEFEEARPYILGAVLDVVAAGLRNLPATKLDRLPRMADFAVWITACEEALPWPAGSFMAAYTGNRQEQIDSALENDPVAQAVKRLLDECGSWEGTASELLEILEELVDERVLRSRSWPGTPRALSGKLKRSATFLRQAGIEVEFARTKHARYIHIYCLGDANGDGGDAWKNFASPLKVPKNRPGDGGDANDDVFSLESKNQKREKQLERVGDFASPPSPLRNDAGSKGDAKNKISSPDTIHRHPEITSTEQSKLWDALLVAITSEELRDLLEFARRCGAEIAFSSKGWRIEAETALSSEYAEWRKAMLPHAKELREALAKLTPPEDDSHLPDVSKEASDKGGNLPCQPGFTFSQEELWTRFLASLKSEDARSLLEVARKRGARVIWDDREKKYQIREDDILNREYIEWYKEALRFLGEVERALDSLVVWEGETV